MFKTRRARPDLEQPERAYTSTEVARIAQVSLRQLQWWDERKVVSPRHEGHKRVYVPEEVVEITIIAELRRKGFSLQKIRRVLRFLQREMGRRLAQLPPPSGTKGSLGLKAATQSARSCTGHACTFMQARSGALPRP